MPIGQVVRAHSHQFYVMLEGREILCRPRGKFRLDRQVVLTGDWVEVHLEGDEGRIDRILPRRNVMHRPAVANVDQALIVFTMREPEADYPFLDRVLVHAERAGVEASILLNKADLLTAEEIGQFLDLYGRQIGYPVIPISATLGIGMDALFLILTGRISVLAGHSGVGKSRLIRVLEPGREDVRVGELSQKVGRGKHTTRHVELIPLSGGGFIADAPGFTYLEFDQMDRTELGTCFREFREPASRCRFDDCVHHREPDCAVRQAVEAGTLPRSRYDNYLSFLAEVEAQKRW